MEVSERGMRRYYGLAIGAILVAGFLLRSPLGLADRDGIYRGDGDSLYQLKRVLLAIDHYPRVAVRDPLCHHPDGLTLHWPNGYPFVLASLALLAGQRGMAECAALLSWLPPLLALVSLILVWRIARCLHPSRLWQSLATGIIAVSHHAAYPTLYGRLDHHAVATAALLALVAGHVERRLWLWASGAFSLMAFTPEGGVLLTLVLGAWYLAGVLRSVWGPLDGRSEGARPALWFGTALAAVWLAWGLDAAVAMEGARGLALDPARLGLFHGLWFALLALLLPLHGVLLGRLAPEREVRILGATAGLLVTGGALVLFLVSTGASPHLAARVAKAGRLLVAEELSPLAGGLPSSPFYFQLLLCAAIAAVWAALRSVRQAHESRLVRVWFWIAAASSLCLLERRWVNVCLPLALLALAFFLERSVALLRRTLAARAPDAAHAGIAIVAGLVPLLLFVSDYRVMSRGAQRGKILFDVALEALGALRAGGDGLPASAEPAEPPGVAAPWYIGHHLNVLGQLPVVADPFNFPDGIEERLQSLWLSRSEEDLIAALERRRARVLVLRNPARDAAEAWHLDGRSAAELITEDSLGVPTYREASRAFAAVRLFGHCGFEQESGRLQPRRLSERSMHYVQEDADPALAREYEVPWVQVYELKPGAVIRGVAPAGVATVRLEALIRVLGSEPMPARRAVPLAEDGSFAIRVAIPAPFQGVGYEVIGPYRLIVEEQLDVLVNVTPLEIDAGAAIDVIRR